MTSININGRAVIYARFSPRRNAADCESCEVQVAQCEQWCADNKIIVKGTYTDRAVSGKTDIGERHLLAAINSLKKGDVLVAYKRDRLARDLMIGLQIERMVEAKGATVAVVTGEVYGNDPSADLMKKMLMVIAEWERRIISERTKASMQIHQAQGKRMSHLPPYGYDVDPTDHKRLVRNEKEQEIIGEIMRMRKEGMSYYKIAAALPPEAHRSHNWHMQNIRNIVYRVEHKSVPI